MGLLAQNVTLTKSLMVSQGYQFETKEWQIFTFSKK